MFIDSYNTIVLEQSPWPGSVGDSAAETGRYKHLKIVLNDDATQVSLEPFFTEKGITRHPTSPWGENDTTSDQVLPLFVAGDAGIKNLIALRLKADGWKTGNGDYVTPMLYALVKNDKVLLNTTVVLQSLAFLIPYRWNESYYNKGKWPLESIDNMSCDYLNFLHGAIYASKWTRWFISKAKLKDRIRHYYKNEPNNEQIIALYDRAIDKYF